MTRATRTLLLVVPATILYFLLLSQTFSTPFLSEAVAVQILPVVSLSLATNTLWLGKLIIRANCPFAQLPWTLLVAFGAYSLGSLGWGLYTFRDCPEAYQELMMVRQFPLSWPCRPITIL